MATTLADLKTYLEITDNSEDSLLSLLLSDAEKEVLNKRYPFGYTEEEITDALERYSFIIRNIAIYLYNKRGAEGETGHSENGINRSYEKAGIPDSFIAGIVPMAKVM